ncbi:predicted protein [Botrytis cinerea T4]|uniref:Uncharacterized protein n=1 Tax=Botryotinia fuckeliana (strain T4) TaxID=999810 RepID=G2XNP0_BOTF4|nr:predicted protein [Botrytis cinerea T4]
MLKTMRRSETQRRSLAIPAWLNLSPNHGASLYDFQHIVYLRAKSKQVLSICPVALTVSSPRSSAVPARK